MAGNQMAVVPQGLQLPAHLQGGDVAAQIAAYNAAAAGGIKIGGFPRISIKGSKFHEVSGGESVTLMQAGSNPPVPLMLLEAVVVSANPNLTKAYFEGEYTPGDDREPVCSSDDGTVPDVHIGQNEGTKKQSDACATCPKNQWGSKISRISGKEVKACTDNKRLVLLPAADLGYKALALNVTPAALGEWGAYVKALSGRGVPVNSVVTNITFDNNASFPKLLFSFGRFLSAEDFERVKQRAESDDVKAIVHIQRAPQAAKPAAPIQAPAPVASAPAPTVTAPLTVSGFGAAAPAPAPAPAPEAPKRSPRKPKAPEAGPVDTSDISHLPLAIQAAVQAVGADTPAGLAIIMQYPKPAPAPVQEPTPAPATTGFGAATPAVPAPTAAGSVGESLRAILAKKLGAPTT